MCGIAGAVLLGGGSARRLDLPATVAAMSARIRHRGPDDDGMWTSADGRVCLAHRRLAVVDLSPRGHQPMASADGRAWTTFNGEIYNFRALRARLVAEGHAFVSDSDTEVVLTAYRAWGLVRALKSFEGMFAFALWDEDSKTLHFARDRAGEKPLFIGVAGGALLFASELKAFRGLPGVSLSLNPRAVSGYLAYGYVPGPDSMFAEVARLAPGSSVSIASERLFASGAAASLSAGEIVAGAVPYWSCREVAAEAERSGPVRPEDALDDIDRLLSDVIRDQLACDVPVGVFLSGGIDSSLVAAIAREVAKKPVTAYTVAFGESEFDESQHAAAVARHLGIAHEILPLSPETITSAVPALAAELDEPTANASYFPLALMSQLARERVTVVLSGDGGDEVFCGYNRYLQLDRLERLSRVVPRRVLRVIAQGAAALASRGIAAGGLRSRSMPQSPPGEALLRAARFLALDDHSAAYDAAMRLFDPSDLAAMGRDPITARAASDAEDRLLAMMAEDFGAYLPDDNLAKVDRAAMSTALEVRLPLLSHAVVAASWRLGRRGWVRGGTSKWALRELLARRTPRQLFNRQKMGFTAPVGAWLAGPLHDWANDVLRSRTAVELLSLGHEFVDREWRSLCGGTRANPRRAWDLVILAAWATSVELTMNGR